jgi:hypothetical protein
MRKNSLASTFILAISHPTELQWGTQAVFFAMLSFSFGSAPLFRLPFLSSNYTISPALQHPIRRIAATVFSPLQG